MEQESPETNPCTIGALFLIKEARIYNGAKIASSKNSAATNTGVHVSFRIVVFSEYMPSSGIAGSYGIYS